MANIRKRSNGTWQATVYVGTSAELDKHGKPKKLYEWITCDSEKECKSKARELETEIENKTYSAYGKMKFKDWCEKWIAVNFIDYSIPGILERTKPKYKPSTQLSYKMYIDAHFVPFFGYMALKDIQEMHIKEYIAKKTKDGLASTTIRRQFYILSSILYDALKIKSPCRDIEAPKTVKYNPVVLEEYGFELFHLALKNIWDEIPLLLAGWCGMREGEIFCLKWPDIDKTNSLITIDENRSVSEFGYMDVDPKSVRGFRTITAPAKIFELLEAHRLKQDKISPYIFPMRPDSYSKRFAKIIKKHNKALIDVKEEKAKRSDFILTGHKRCVEFNLAPEPLPVIRFHDLRHYHTTFLHNHGFSDQYASERIGDDIMVLKKVYQHLDSLVKKQADEKIKEMFK